MTTPPLPARIEMVDDRLAEAYRRMTPTQRVAIAGAAHRTARLLIEGNVRTRHQDWDDARVGAEVSRRMLGGVS